MKLTILALASILSFSLFAQQTNETITIGPDNRSYIKYLPTAFDQNTESLPVVFILHGLGDVASNMAGVGTNNIADTARFIAIYPQGVQNSYGSNAWNNGTLLSSTVDDVAFIDALITEMILSHNADPSRIYVTGFSMGGIMSYHLACNLNDRIAAIASMSGTMSTSDISSCVPSYKTPVMHLHGTADGTVPYDSGALPSLSLVPETMAFWEGVHTCGTTPDSTQIPNTANDGLTVDRFAWTGCTPSESLELWRINGGDHIYFYEPVNDFTEANEIWRFFYRWTHPNPAGVSLNENSSNALLNVFPNPTKELITLTSNAQTTISIVDVNGKTCLTTEVNAGKTTIDVSDLEEGIYLVKSTNGKAERLVIQ